MMNRSFDDDELEDRRAFTHMTILGVAAMIAVGFLFALWLLNGP